MKELPTHKLDRYILPGESRPPRSKKKCWKIVVVPTNVTNTKRSKYSFFSVSAERTIGTYFKKKDAEQAIEHKKNSISYSGCEFRIEKI